jgi:hypothetical protein
MDATLKTNSALAADSRNTTESVKNTVVLPITSPSQHKSHSMPAKRIEQTYINHSDENLSSLFDPAAPALQGIPVDTSKQTTNLLMPDPHFCLLAFYLYLDDENIKSRVRGVDLLSPYSNDHWRYERYKLYALSYIEPQYMIQTEVIPPQRWICRYGPKTSRLHFHIRNSNDFEEFERVCIASKSTSAEIYAQYSLKRSPSFPLLEHQAKKAYLKHCFEEFDAICTSPKRMKLPCSMIGQDEHRNKGNMKTADEWVQQLEYRWRCNQTSSCDQLVCWIQPSSNKHCKLRLRDVEQWAHAIISTPDIISVDAIPRSLMQTLLRRQKHRDQIAKQRNATAPKQTTPKPQMISIQPQVQPSYIQPSLPTSPVCISPRPESPSLPRLRYLGSTSPSIFQPQFEQISSPLHPCIELEPMLAAFETWLQNKFLPNRVPFIAGMIETIRIQGWTLEELRRIDIEQAVLMNLPLGPFELLKAQISPFKAYYKCLNAKDKDANISLQIELGLETGTDWQNATMKQQRNLLTSAHPSTRIQGNYFPVLKLFYYY